MRFLSPRRLPGRVGLIAVALAAGVGGFASPVSAGPAGAGGPVSTTPATGTPHFPTTSGKATEDIHQLVQCGGLMYAVGKFSTILQGGQTYARDNAFSFSATPPYMVTSWAPQVNGPVNSIAFSGGNCSDAYIGGQFTSVGGTTVSNLAEIDTGTGAVVTAFGPGANGPVDTLLAEGGHLIVGGNFKYVNGSRNPYMTSLNPLTGRDDGFIHLKISGYYHFCDNSGRCSQGRHSEIDNQQLSHNGTLDLVEGSFTSVGGKLRQQIFMLNLATNPASVTGWTSPEFDGSAGNLPNGYPYQCMFSEAWYIRSAAWSPDDKTVYIATTGFHPWNLPTGSYPRSGLCDAVAAFPATQAKVLHTWVEYSGCDSYYSVAADNGAVYAAGHVRWSQNPDGCNAKGPGAVPDRGLQGLAPASGSTLLNSRGTALYHMSRANGDGMLITSAGLWIASGNRYQSDNCEGVSGLAGICFLPYGP